MARKAQIVTTNINNEVKSVALAGKTEVQKYLQAVAILNWPSEDDLPRSRKDIIEQFFSSTDCDYSVDPTDTLRQEDLDKLVLRASKAESRLRKAQEKRQADVEKTDAVA